MAASALSSLLSSPAKPSSSISWKIPLQPSFGLSVTLLRRRPATPTFVAAAIDAKPTILVTEKLGEAGIDLLKDVANVDCSYDLSPEELCIKISLCYALIVRSGTKVTRDVFEREAVADAKNKIHDAIVKNFDIDKSLKLSTGSNSIRIADFGCSTGPNTFEAMQHITEVVYKKYNTTMNLRHKPLEFQVFFNDQVNNDFNTLFATLPRTSPKYFVAAVPGSFHGRLFPENTLHIGFSSCTLHWLSRIPEDVQNKGSIYFTGNDVVFQAYSAQHKKDMDNFLSARAQEMTEGGLLLLILPLCLKEYGNYTSKTQFGVKCELLGSCLMDMANMGMISKEKVESFNLPVYFPSLMEWNEIIESNGYFSIEMIEPSLPSRPHISSNHLRAGLEELLAHHFGEHIIDHLFDLHNMKMEEIPTCDIEATFTVFACLKLKSKLCE